jgi:hypothetical protein
MRRDKIRATLNTVSEDPNGRLINTMSEYDSINQRVSTQGNPFGGGNTLRRWTKQLEDGSPITDLLCMLPVTSSGKKVLLAGLMNSSICLGMGLGSDPCYSSSTRRFLK